MTGGYALHPHIGGRAEVLSALAAWRMEWPGTPRVIVLTGGAGSGVSRLLDGFLMLCDPKEREQLPLHGLDPVTVPPVLPAPAVLSVAGLTVDQALRRLAGRFGLKARDAQELWAGLAGLAAREEPVTVVVPDGDRAGAIRAAGGPARLVREVLRPLAATENVWLLAELPRALAEGVGAGLPRGTVRVIDVDDPEWADPEGLVLQAGAALDARSGSCGTPLALDTGRRQALAEAIAARAGTSRLTVRLAVDSILADPNGFDPADERPLPGTVGEALDLHARRLGADPEELRLLLTPLAFAEGGGLPAGLWAPLATSVAGRDMSGVIADGTALTAPFAESADGAVVRLVHPALGEEIRSRVPDARAAQAEIAVALLAAVPDQDWSRADPYVRDYIAAHALEAGLLPRLLTDPALFAHADPVPLRAAVEAAPPEALGAAALTFRRTAPLLTRAGGPVPARAALLETAFVEDGLPDFADALHSLGVALPWRTLWSLQVAGAGAVTVGSLGERGPQVAALVVPQGTPGAVTIGGSAVLVHGLTGPAPQGADPARIVLRDKASRAAEPLRLSRGRDFVRVRDRATGKVIAALACDTPVTGADISPDGVLVVTTGRGARALLISRADEAGSPDGPAPTLDRIPQARRPDARTTDARMRIP